MTLATTDAPQSAPTEARVYFPQLDGLRFIAFMMVYLFHGGVSQAVMGRVIGRTAAAAFRENGGYGVQLFLILSGYLIVSLLLREESRWGRIALGAFWIRRILRIWPLYYLIVILGFAVLPGIDGLWGTTGYAQTLRIHLLPFTFFLGNWSMALVSPIPHDWLSVLWSVCVEEQFYLVVPLLIAWIKPGLRIPLVVALMAGSIGYRGYCAHHYGSQLMIVFNSFAQFDTLLAGVLLALVLRPDRARPRLAWTLMVLQWPLYAACAWVIAMPKLGHGEPFHRTWDFVWVWLCAVGIVLVAVEGRGWLGKALAYSRLVWLGKISYGLYMYHEIVLWMRGRLEPFLPWFPNKDELLAIACLTLVIAISAASYRYYESRFLELKRGWTRVPSRPV